MALLGSFDSHHADTTLLMRPASEPLLDRTPKMFKRRSVVGDFDEGWASGGSMQSPGAVEPHRRLRSCLRHCDSPPNSAPELSRHVSWDAHVSMVAVTPNSNKRTPPRPAVFSGLHWEVERKLDFEVDDTHGEMDVLLAALAEAVAPCNESGKDDVEEHSDDEEEQKLEDLDEAKLELEHEISSISMQDGYKGWSLKKSSSLAAPGNELGATWQSPARQRYFPAVAA